MILSCCWNLLPINFTAHTAACVSFCLSLVMRKPVFVLCEQQRCRSACTSSQSDQISTFVVHFLGSIILLLAPAEISPAEQAGLSLSWSQTPKTGFLVTWLISKVFRKAVHNLAYIVGPDQDWRSSLIRVYAVCHSISNFWTHYSMAKPHCSNFRIITTFFPMSEFFRSLLYNPSTSQQTLQHVSRLSTFPETWAIFTGKLVWMSFPLFPHLQWLPLDIHIIPDHILVRTK